MSKQTLEEVIRQRLDEAKKELKDTADDKEENVEATGKQDAPEVDTSPKLKKDKAITKESEDTIVPESKEETVTPEVVAEDKKDKTVSSQVSALLEAEGLSDEFKLQAVTIFEAAVADRVLQIEEDMKKEFDVQLAEAKNELETDIDGFLTEAVQQWRQDNEVAIKQNFKTELAESFIDGLKALVAEHNIEVPEGKENALEVALSEVDTLKESIEGKATEMAALQEEINSLKSKQILESFRSKMALTEFDRFTQLTESIKFVDDAQYAKQLTIVLENFGAKQKVTETVDPVIAESVSNETKVITENTSVSAYAAYISKKR